MAKCNTIYHNDRDLFVYSTSLIFFAIRWDLLEESTYQGSISYISCNDGIAQAG